MDDRFYLPGCSATNTGASASVIRVKRAAATLVASLCLSAGASADVGATVATQEDDGRTARANQPIEASILRVDDHQRLNDPDDHEQFDAVAENSDDNEVDDELEAVVEGEYLGDDDAGEKTDHDHSVATSLTDESANRAPQEAASLLSEASLLDVHRASREEQAVIGDEARRDALATLRGNDMVQVVVALAVVIGLLFATKVIFARAGRSLGGGRPSGVVEILARYPVARGQQLILLKLARRVLLVHQNGTAMTTLSEIVDEHEVAALLGRVEAANPTGDGSPFKAIFSRFSSEHEMANDFSKATSPSGQSEIIDLTKRQPRSLFKSMFAGKGGSS